MSWWRRQYIGTVTGSTVHMKGEMEIGRTIVVWILTIRPFGLGRSARQVGKESPLGISQHHQLAHARVKAWLRGGPLPPMDKDTRDKPPTLEKPPAPVIRLVASREDAR